MNENNSNFTQTIFVRKHSQVPKENVRISNTKEGEAKGDKHIVRDLGRGGSQEKVRGSQANVRISNSKEDRANGDKYIVRDLGFRAWDGRYKSPKCCLRKTSADHRQMSGSQIPKRIRQKGQVHCPGLGL